MRSKVVLLYVASIISLFSKAIDAFLVCPNVAVKSSSSRRIASTCSRLHAAKAKKGKAKKAKKAEADVPTLRKGDLVASIAEKTGMTKTDSEAALSAVLETIQEGVAGGSKVSLVGFGTFKTTHRAARTGRNPRTGEEISIAASSSPSFTAAKAFKERLNES